MSKKRHKSAQRLSPLRPSVKTLPAEVACTVQQVEALQAASRHPEAERIARNLVLRYPTSPAAQHLIGDTLARQGRFLDAIPCYRRAVTLIENAPVALHPLLRYLMLSLASMLRPIDPPGALDLANMAAVRGFLSADDEISRKFRGHAAHAFLTMGDFAQGWPMVNPADSDRLSASWYPSDAPPVGVCSEEYARERYLRGVKQVEISKAEADRVLLSRRLPAERNARLWDGSPLNGKTICVFTEAGFGDVIQWMRWIPTLKQRFGAGRVVLVCPSILARVLMLIHDFSRWVDDFHVVPGFSRPREMGGRNPVDIAGLPVFDCWTGLLYLPCFLDRVGFLSEPLPWDDAPCHGRFLAADTQEAARWEARLCEIEGGKRPPLRIGVVWQAGSYVNGKERSFPARLLAPLADMPGAALYSLQKGEGAEQVADVPEIVPLSEEINDFAETVAVMQNLNFIVTCDTSVVHLAGAMGRGAFVMLPYAADWRWGKFEAPAMSYPRFVRKFQQTVDGDWSGPFARLVKYIEDTRVS